jgi:hypothetical protein
MEIAYIIIVIIKRIAYSMNKYVLEVDHDRISYQKKLTISAIRKARLLKPQSYVLLDFTAKILMNSFSLACFNAFAGVTMFLLPN